MIQPLRDGARRGIEEQSTEVVRWIMKISMIVIPVVILVVVAKFGPWDFFCNTGQNVIPFAGGALIFAGFILLTSNPILAIIVALSSGLIFHFSSVKDVFC